MRLRHFSAALAVVALVAISPVRAQTPPAPSADAMEAARELFSFLSKDLLGQMTAQMTTMTWPLIERELASRVDAKVIGELRREFERIQLENISDVLKDAPVIYARRFSAAELRELIAFYRSPTGQKTLRELPQIMGETVALLTPRLQDIQMQTQNAFGRVLRDRGYIK